MIKTMQYILEIVKEKSHRKVLKMIFKSISPKYYMQISQLDQMLTFLFVSNLNLAQMIFHESVQFFILSLSKISLANKNQLNLNTNTNPILNFYKINMQEREQVQPLIAENQHVLPISQKSMILADAHGPYLNAPKRVKEIFDMIIEEGTINFTKFDFSKLCLPAKKTKTNICTHIFNPSEKYYYCRNCCYDNNIVFCEACFEKQKHQGHQFLELISKYKGGFCDCGRIDRMKEAGLCIAHSYYHKVLECYITEQERKQFIECFVSIIECCLYKGPQKFLDQVIQFFISLNQGSVHYNRLVFQLLSMTTKTQNEKFKNQTYLSLFLGPKRKNLEEMLLQLGGDLRTKKNLAKIILSTQIKIQKRIKQQLITLTVAEQLISQQFINIGLYKIIKLNENKVSKEFMQNLNKKMVKEAKNIKQLSLFSDNTQTLQSSINVIKRLGELFKYRNSNSQSQQQSEQKQLALNLIEKNFFIFGLSNIQNPLKIREILLSNGIKDEKIDDMLRLMIQNCEAIVLKKINNGANYRIYFIIILVLLKGSNRKKQLTKKLWNRLLFYGNKNFKQKLDEFVDLFHTLLSIIFNIQITLIVEARNQLKRQKQVNSERINKKFEDWFKFYLYQEKEVTKKKILDLIYKGYLNFPDAGKILNSLCTYNQDRQTFIYSDANSSKIEYCFVESQHRKYAKNNTKLLQKIYVQESSLTHVLLKQFLNVEGFFHRLDKFWKERSPSSQITGYLYLYFMVVFDNLSNGSCKQIAYTLDFVKSKQLFSRFAGTDAQIKLIHQLFGIEEVKKSEMMDQKKQKVEQKEIKTQMQENIQKKYEEKKKKIAERFSKTRLLLLEKSTSFQKEQIQSEEQKCILCHDRSKPGNQLYYQSQIKKNTVIEYFYGKNNCGKSINLVSCFHPLHLDCYNNLYQQKLQYSCPLCKLKRNCLIPALTSQLNKNNIKLCSNLINAFLFLSKKNLFASDDLFMVIFNHLFLSKGLYSVSSKKYQEKRNNWQKNDDFLLKLIIQIYQNSSKSQKQIYLQSISDLLTSVEKCEKKQFRLIQLLIGEALKYSLTGEDQNCIQKLLLQARSIIDEDVFSIISMNVSLISNHQYQLGAQNEEELKNKKVDFSLPIIQLPETAKQFLKVFNADQSKCQICKERKTQYICMLCSKATCVNCPSQHSSSAHNQLRFYIQISNLLVNIKVQESSRRNPVYYNEFHIAYQEAQNLKILKDSNFYLNKKKLVKMIEECFF